MSPAMIVVFALPGETLKITGAAQLVPAGDSAVGAAENPLSVAIMPVGNFTTDPISP